MESNDFAGALPLSALTGRVADALTLHPGLSRVWVTAETSDLRCSGGHCYMELIEKRDDGVPVAKCRAVIWAATYRVLAARFAADTGTQLRSDMKVMVLASVNYHPVYGISLVIADINSEYTVGDLARRRRQILDRLAAEGVADFNRSLPWSATPWRVAVISAAGAAGYGDFVKQLHGNPARLRFATTLFPAAMQGERTAPEVIAALDKIMADIDSYDCVVIIRGGGAVADLAWFDDYELAANVAQFPLPVIVGIGHERDINVLDYVANTSVKTPTAAAQALISRMTAAYAAVAQLGADIFAMATAIIGGYKEQLAYYQGNIPVIAAHVIARQRQGIASRAEMLGTLAQNAVQRQRQKLTAMADMVEVLSPTATLRRGYSITRIDGRAVTDSAGIAPGTRLTTQFADGPEITSLAE